MAKIGEDKTKVDLFYGDFSLLRIQTKNYLHSHTQMVLQKGKCIEKRISRKLSDATCSPALECQVPGSRNSLRK